MKVYLTERQVKEIVKADMLTESFIEDFDADPKKAVQKLETYVLTGLISVAFAVTLINKSNVVPQEMKNEAVVEIAKKAPQSEWTPICDDAIITVYNAKPSQCNNDFGHTATMFRLNLNNISSHRIVAMERTMMQEFGLKYGDVIKIEGTSGGKQDGIYQIQDTMNKRFAGQHKIDVLSPEDVVYGGTDEGKTAKVYVLSDRNNTAQYKGMMAPQVSKEESRRQVKQRRQMWMAKNAKKNRRK